MSIMIRLGLCVDVRILGVCKWSVVKNAHKTYEEWFMHVREREHVCIYMCACVCVCVVSCVHASVGGGARTNQLACGP